MLTIRRYEDADHDAVWLPHNLALTAVGGALGQRLYLEHGFHETGRAVIAGFDSILMEKRL